MHSEKLECYYPCPIGAYVDSIQIRSKIHFLRGYSTRRPPWFRWHTWCRASTLWRLNSAPWTNEWIKWKHCFNELEVRRAHLLPSTDWQIILSCHHVVEIIVSIFLPTSYNVTYWGYIRCVRRKHARRQGPTSSLCRTNTTWGGFLRRQWYRWYIIQHRWYIWQTCLLNLYFFILC